MTTGMEDFAAQAGALAGQAAGLRAAVDNGQLVMDPAAAERVAKVYEEKADKLNSKAGRLDQLVVRDAFGACHIGRQLGQKFEDKVNAPDVGLVAILDKMEQILRDMGQAYRDSARVMQSTDDEHAQNLGRNF
ncbi:hypothetical protein [Saccharopolyspora sp. 5N708]|uniref:hypothetical protein n=1 Tax=Saccharopolyspora sp. 5N708 TaxID=3457424 RepID=UPI003FCFF17B